MQQSLVIDNCFIANVDRHIWRAVLNVLTKSMRPFCSFLFIIHRINSNIVQGNSALTVSPTCIVKIFAIINNVTTNTYGNETVAKRIRLFRAYFAPQHQRGSHIQEGQNQNEIKESSVGIS